MVFLIVGLLLLISFQGLYNYESLRLALIAKFGAASYVIGCGVVLLMAFALIVHGKSTTSYSTVWLPPATLKLYVMPLMFVGFVIGVTQYVPSNLRRWLPRPLMCGALVWFITHLLVKGDLASMVLFGGLAIFAGVGCLGKRREFPKISWLKESLPIAIGGVSYFILFLLHGSLFGVAPTMMGRGFF
jgi:uncharacterized membrane protein